MSDVTEESLKESLLKLQCHFTWNLFEEGLEIDNIEERLYEQIVFSPYGNKHRIYNLLAYLKHLQGYNDEAILQLEKAEKLIQKADVSEDLDVQSIVTNGNYAWMFYHQNQFMKSSTYVKKVENILKKYECSSLQHFLLLEIYSEKAWTYVAYPGQWYDKAAEYFEKALELDPENPELNSGYAIVVYRMQGMNRSSNQTDRSAPLLERAVQLNPKDTVVKTLLALTYQDLKTYEHAQKLIKEALREGSESPFVLKYVAKFYRRKQMYNDAIAMLKKALNITPTSAALHYQLAICYKKMIKETKQSAYEAKRKGQSMDTQQKDRVILNAIFHLKRAVEIKTTFVQAYIVLAAVYVQAQKYHKAEETFHKTLSMKNIRCIEKQELHNIWACYEKNTKKSESEAIKNWKAAVMIKQQSLFREYSIEGLKSLAETMIAQKSAKPTGYGILGFLHQQEGQDKLAAEYYKKALQLGPGNQEYLEALSTLQCTFSSLSVN